jgi:DNA-binding HxlR family transcriptional regulator
VGVIDRSDDEYVREMVAIISNKWTLPVMYTLKDGTKRYGEINSILSDMTQKVLTETLHKMERNGLISRAVYPSVPPKVEYELTELGMSLLGIIVSLLNWTKDHFHHVYSAQETYDSRPSID